MPKVSIIWSDGVTLTRNSTLRGMSMIYLIAFVSFYYQSAGLFGNNGVAPARLQIESPPKEILSDIVRKPTLLYLASYCGLDVEYMLDWHRRYAFYRHLLCLYGSLIQITQLFAGDADYLLLEALFVIIMLVPLSRWNQPSPSDEVIYLFETGATKFISRCPHWWNFTALSHYFETMPLPTVIAWASHNFVANWMRLTNIFANFSELVVVWFFFFPNATVRRYVFYWQVFLQLNIMMTGNFGFLNLMLLVLLFCLLDDNFMIERICKGVIVHAVKVLVVPYAMFFGIGWIISSSIDTLKFEEEYLDIIGRMVKTSPLVATSVIISTFLINLTSHRVITHTIG